VIYYQVKHFLHMLISLALKSDASTGAFWHRCFRNSSSALIPWNWKAHLVHEYGSLVRCMRWENL